VDFPPCTSWLAPARERSQNARVASHDSVPTQAEREQRLGALAASSGLDLSRARARAGFTRGHLIDVVVYAGEGDARARDVAERATRDLLGAALWDAWIGEVMAAPLPRGGPLAVVGSDVERTFPLCELPDAVTAAIDGLLRGLPSEPLYRVERDSGWTLFDLEPELGVDYAEQDDLVVCSTLTPELVKAYLQGLPIHSGRFSRHGELFCYMKLDGDGAPSTTRLACRNAIQNALDAQLARNAAGCVVGDGMGLRYSYVSLALADPERGQNLACEVARTAGAPDRSWLLFYDVARRREWRGVWDRTPPPRFD
jgi:hypothetical protein